MARMNDWRRRSDALQRFANLASALSRNSLETRLFNDLYVVRPTPHPLSAIRINFIAITCPGETTESTCDEIKRSSFDIEKL